MRWKTLLPAMAPLLLIGGCGADSEPPPQPGEATEPVAGGVELAQVDTLEGTWQVTSVDGETLRFPLTFEADATHVWWEPKCAGVVFSYAIDGPDITIGSRTDVTPPPPGTPPPPVCTVGLPPMLAQAREALVAAQTAGVTADGTVRLAGAGRTLGMIPANDAAVAAEPPPAPPPPAPPSPSPTPTPDIANDRWLVGEYRVAGVDGDPLDLPHGVAVSVTADMITLLSQCITARWTYRLRNESIGTDLVPTVTCQRGLYPQERAMMNALEAATSASRTEANGILIAGGGRSITLFSQ